MLMCFPSFEILIGYYELYLDIIGIALTVKD